MNQVVSKMEEVKLKGSCHHTVKENSHLLKDKVYMYSQLTTNDRNNDEQRNQKARTQEDPCRKLETIFHNLVKGVE